VVEGFEPKRSAPARSGARPGWKPGDGRNASPAKPGQRSFSKPGAAPTGQREGGYRNDNAPRRERSAGGFGSGHPRSADSARRSFGDR
jgi:hypothetical protein